MFHEVKFLTKLFDETLFGMVEVEIVVAYTWNKVALKLCIVHRQIFISKNFPPIVVYHRSFI